MRIIPTLAALLAATPAAAHVGHWGDLAGHHHWVAGAALGAAAIAAILAGRRGRRPEDGAREEDAGEGGASADDASADGAREGASGTEEARA